MQYPNLVATKTAQNEVAHIEWNPGMDLFATVFCNGALTCCRLMGLQKVWHKQPEGTIHGTAWRPDGRVLAIGTHNSKTKEYSCTLHDVENGQEIHKIKIKKAITSVGWFQLTQTDDDKQEQKQRKSIKEKGDTFSHQLAHDQTQVNILSISTDDGKISFYALGLFYLGDISLHDDPDSKIIKTHFSSCLRYVTAVIQTRHAHAIDTSYKVFNLDTFHVRSKEMLTVSKMYAKIIDELEYLDDTMNALTTSWADVLAGLDSKLSSFSSRKIRNPDESQSGYTFISADELLQLLVIGYTSDNLEKFLHDMSDKGLKKLNNAIEQTCLRVQNLIVKNAEKCCYHLHGDLNTLRGFATEPDGRYCEVGLHDKCLVDAMRSVGALMLKLTELQQVIDHSLKSSKSFFRWLISIACRMNNEQNNSMVPSDINKTTQQDIQLITDFILENFDYNQDELDELANTRDSHDDSDEQSMNRPTCSNFTLEQIGQYLKDESLTRLKYSFSKPGSNFLIEFLKQRPELTQTKISKKGSAFLLFYPHNPETSLIQEYKDTCQSIRAAFGSIASNMTKLFESHRTVFQLKDFVRGSPASRVKVETDLKRMEHYILFQKKSEPVLKQYLLVQMLNDVHDRQIDVFRFTSIEFSVIGEGKNQSSSSRTSSAPQHGYPLAIADSNFYENKDTKELLITFLLQDKISDNTLIVQVELSKILPSLEVCVDPIAKEPSRIWKNCDKLRFTLDIHREPPRERKHTLNVMVKKIKRTIGLDMFLSSGRGVIAFTSCSNKRLHLYELDCLPEGSDIQDDEPECDERLDESSIDTDLVV